MRSTQSMSGRWRARERFAPRQDAVGVTLSEPRDALTRCAEKVCSEIAFRFLLRGFEAFDSVPVSMMVSLNVSRPTIAAQSLEPVNVFVRQVGLVARKGNGRRCGCGACEPCSEPV
ncbi:hypothetical protein NNW97_20600 [Streptomyces parvus]|nr:hypothetical protein [Streptomyces parvus]MCQ1579294.1 hypothetical protein [Streptomyces parvus]